MHKTYVPGKNLNRVNYICTYHGHGFENSYPVECWEGSPLDLVWNSQKCWFMPGSQVTITDNLGNSKTFMRGVK